MAESDSNDVSQGAAPDENNPAAAAEISQLRTLLFGPELEARLYDAQLRAEDVSRVLPEAIILRSVQQDDQLTKAIVPTVEGAIQESVKQDLNVLADALFPVIGPATRKAVATALKTLTQSLNQTVDNSLSLQSFKWRLEARQTGKTFAEVVLLRTLIYRVEQVLLIHKRTGLALQHLVAETGSAQDPDLVSAMLTALQNFIQDSFNVQQGDTLETLQFGELTIWIEPGPQAILVGVIRGNAPQELRLLFQKTIERIHREFIRAFDTFQGDPAAFEASREYLEDCLQAQYKPRSETPSPILWVILGLILLAIGAWGFFTVRAKLQWAAYLAKLNNQPGIVVTRTKESFGRYFISGLRDPLAADPIELMKEVNVNPKKVVSRWEPYLSFSPSFIAARAKQLLQPPSTVSLQVDENGILSATGSAPQQWINEAQKLARGVPGITQFQTRQLNNAELKEFESSQAEIERQVLQFSKGSMQLEPGQENELQALVREIQQLTKYARLLSKDVRIEIIGRASQNGSEETNRLLSQARADRIQSILVSQGLKQTIFSALGVGTKEPLRSKLAIEDKNLDRSVSFRVVVSDASKGEAFRP